jgi:hypothetical protein
MNLSESLTAETGKKRPDWPRRNYRNVRADTATALPDFIPEPTARIHY